MAILVRGRIRAEGRLSELLERRDAVRFTATGLPPEKEEACRAALEAAGATVETDRPSSTLERFFLDILRRTEEEGE